MPGVFVSYRREDTGGHAGRLWEELSERYGENLVFWDLERIHGGDVLEAGLSEAVRDCDVLVALIGSRWVDMRDAGGNRRLDNPEDYVRREVAWGLNGKGRRVPVLPVLVEGASMPSAGQLPPDMRPLADIAALELRNRSWPYDIDLLTKEIDPSLWPPEPPARGPRRLWQVTRTKLAGTPKAARRTTLAAVALVALLAALVVHGSGWLHGLELSTIDTRFSLRGARDAPDDMVLVGFDRGGLAKIGESWPPDRRVHARLIDRLRAAGAAMIAYDITFTEPKSVRADNALFDAMDRAADSGRFVLAGHIDERGETVVMGGSGEDLRAQTGVRVAPPFTANDPGAILRRISYTFQGVKTFAVAAAEEAARRPIEPFQLGGRDPWIDYAGPPGTFPVTSFAEVLDGSVPAESLRGKVVVVGQTDTSLGDAHSTPLSDERAMSGPEVVANQLDTLRDEAPLRSASGTVDRFLILLLAVLGPLLALRLTVARSQLAVVLTAVAFLIAAVLLFSSGIVLDVVHPLLAAVIALAGLLAVRERVQRTRKVARHSGA